MGLWYVTHMHQATARPRVLLLTPPLTQLNTPYPATAYLTGFLRARGYQVEQADIGIEMVLALFSRSGLETVFTQLRCLENDLPGEAKQMVALASAYIDTIEPVVAFLQGQDHSLAPRICQRTWLPEGPRFNRLSSHDSTEAPRFGTDQAKHLATLYLEDLADLVGHTVAPQFALSRYAEAVGTAASSFDQVLAALALPPSCTDQWMLEALDRHVDRCAPGLIGLTVPFPGNLYGAFRLAQRIKARWPQITIALGGGYVNTELRRVADPRVFDYVDYITLDDGERPLLSILQHLAGSRPETALPRTFVRRSDRVQFVDGLSDAVIPMGETGTPTYEGLPLSRYLSILDTTNPMHRLWSDGHWNKLTVAHGCYWKRCTFCDVGLDYIGRYEPTPHVVLLDRIEQLVAETGRRGFHFVDEAAPPAGLKALALGLLERRLSIAWWGNIRFEQAFTPDLCRLFAASGCIAVSAGLEVASDRLLAKMKKGITVDQTAQVARAFREAGILIHAYLMYGFPGETIDETVESLERVRQLFAADLIQSAFWHKFVTTAHSPIGLNPKAHGIRIVGPSFAGFADNDLFHTEEQGAVPEWLGKGLRSAVTEYLEGRGLDRQVSGWFEQQVRTPRVSRQWVVRAGTRRDEPAENSRQRQLVWTGTTPILETSMKTSRAGRNRVILPNRHQDEVLALPAAQADWLVALLASAMPSASTTGDGYPSWQKVRQGYPFGGSRPFDRFTTTTTWHKIRRAGLLLV